MATTRTSLLVVVVLAAANCMAYAQSGVGPEIVVLARAQQRVAARLKVQRDYVCLQTVERRSKSSPKKAFKAGDTVRLEVAYIGGQEYFAWPGARKFEHTNPSSFNSSGTLSAGSFAGDLSVALGRSATAKFVRAEELSGRRTLRYDYEVSPLLHQATISAFGQNGTASVRGSFWVDPESHDVVRVETQAHEISPGVPLAALVSVTDYGVVRIGSEDVWLPQAATEIVSFTTGQEDQNRTYYSHCRSYAGESTIRFDDAVTAQSGSPKAQTKSEVALPKGLRLSIALDTDIDLTRAAVGDLIRGTVQEEVTAASRPPVTIPKGAVVHGRIRLLTRGSDATPHTVLGLEFSEIELQESRAAFYARLEQLTPASGIQRSLEHTSRRTSTIGGGAVQSFGKEVVETEQVYLTELPGVGTFFVDRGMNRIPKGLKMLWLTQVLR